MLRKISTLILVALCHILFAQAGENNHAVLLKSRTVITEADFAQRAGEPVSATEIFSGRYYRLIQFDELLTKNQRDQMEAVGLHFLGYIPNRTYYISIPSGFDLTTIQSFHPRSLIALLPADKMSNALRNGYLPETSRNKDGSVNLAVVYYSDITATSAVKELASLGCTLLESFDASSQVSVSIQANNLQALVSSPAVKHIEALSPSSIDDTKGRSLHRSNAINTDYGAGRHYDGSGVSIALADDGEVGPHIDYTGRMTNTFNTGPGGSHGDMTSGICMGAGNLDPVIRGMATGSQIYIYDIGPYPPDTLAGSYPQVVDAAQHFTDFGTVVISTSYSSGACNDYDAFASMTDRIFHDLRVVCPVWSAGNSQGSDCGYGAGGQWGNITGGFKQGKNLIAVANLDAHEVIDNTSSHGPASDGRIKPDISANGKDQMSIAENNTFQVGGGTSAACPSVAGVTAQCYQAYREITGEPNPDAALIKGCLLNGAWDIGTAGPDYAFGYGRINGLRAVQTLEQFRHKEDSVLNGVTNTHTIAVPANTKQFKVMVIWSDPEGDPNAFVSLVNNLDMVVTDPSLNDFNPWVLDPTPNAATLALPAVRRIDTLNNMEQVTIDNPASGIYTVSVTGTSVPFGPQKYFLVYEFWDDNITVTYPIGGEGFVPSETEVLRWDAFEKTGNFLIEYSEDDGTSWNQVANVPGTERQYDWTVPAAISGKCLVRVSRGASSDVSDADFSIVGVPANPHVVWACVDSVKLAWNAVTGVSGYEVSRLGAMYMDSVAYAATNEVVLHGINSANTEWFSVRALTNGAKGRRAIAIQKLPGLVNCSMAEDMELTSMTPASGNFYDCGTGLDSVPVSALITNLGFNNASGFSLTYTINGINPVTENFVGALSFGQSSLFTFAATADLSAGGTFDIDVTVNYGPDLYLLNNTASSSISVALPAMAPLTEDFEGGIFPPAYWDTLNSANGTSWYYQTGIMGSGGNNTSAVVFDNCSFNTNGAEDKLVTQLYDISGLTSPLVTFDVCYREWPGYVDALRVDISTDCGASFALSPYYKESPALSTVPGVNGCFTPGLASDWRRDSIDLSSVGSSTVLLRFVNIGGFGNLLFIDNVNVIQNSPLGIDDGNAVPQLSVFPNPSNGLFQLVASNVPGSSLTMSILDAHGRIVGERVLKNGGRITSSFDLSDQPAGVYYLRLSNEQKVYHVMLTKM